MLHSLLKVLLDTISPTAIAHALVYIGLAIGLASGILQYNANTRLAHRKPRHLRKYGHISKSNLSDQYDAAYDIPEDSTSNRPARVKAIFIHPIKSCKYLEVDRALLTKTGFAHDRSFAIARKASSEPGAPQTWQFISQRTKPKMSQVRVELWLPHDKSDVNDPMVQSGGCLVVSFPDPRIPTLRDRLNTFLETWDLSAVPKVHFMVPLIPTTAQIKQYRLDLTEFSICGRAGRGLNMSRIPEVAEALPKLKTFLAVSNREELTLFRCTPDTLTRTDTNLAPLRHIGTPSMHGYTDEQPVNFMNLASVHAVSALLPRENQPLNALRFRANMYITGPPAFSEESWKRYRVLPKSGSKKARANVVPTLSVVCRTARCTMPTVDPDKGVFTMENPLPGKKKGQLQPSATLLKYRFVEEGNNAALGFLGMHCVPEDSTLQRASDQGDDLYIEVGDEIEVIETGVHQGGATKDEH